MGFSVFLLYFQTKLQKRQQHKKSDALTHETVQ